MDKLVNGNSTTQGAEPASIPRRSIVLKLTLFVGILVSLTAGTLITVGYLYTSQMLSDQIDARLSAAAEDRQGLLRSRLAHLDERVRLIANRTRFRDLLDRHARGVITPEAFGAGAARIFDDVRTGWTEFMAIWIESDSGKVVASSGEPSLVAMFAVPEAPRVPVAPDSS